MSLVLKLNTARKYALSAIISPITTGLTCVDVRLAFPCYLVAIELNFTDFVGLVEYLHQINRSMYYLQTEYAHEIKNECIESKDHERNDIHRPLEFNGV